MLEVCLLGTGGMMPLPYRHLTSLMMRLNGHSLLIDCGEATQIAIRKKGWSFKPIDVLCFTHFHADHISGLPGLLLTMGNADRTEDLTIVGPKGVEKIVGALRMIAPELPFKIKFVELTGEEEELSFFDYRIKAFKVNHNITCYGYSVEVDRLPKFDVEKAKLLPLPNRFWGQLQRGENVEFEGVLYTPDMVMGNARKGLKLTYTTDTRPTESIEKNADGSDLFIYEGMYGLDESADKAVAYKHTTMEEAVRTAAKIKVGELWLTHFSPSLNKPAVFEQELKTIFPRTVIGKDGMSKILYFSEEEEGIS